MVLLGDGTHSEGDIDSTLLIFGVVRYKRPSVGEIDDHLATRSIRTKYGVGSILPKKRRKKREMKKGEKKRRQKEKKEKGRKRERERE
jgi:hypothetical protein